MCRWPAIQWVLEEVLLALGFRICAIRATMDMAERTSVLADFCVPAKGWAVLVGPRERQSETIQKARTKIAELLQSDTTEGRAFRERQSENIQKAWAKGAELRESDTTSLLAHGINVHKRCRILRGTRQGLPRSTQVTPQMQFQRETLQFRTVAGSRRGN